MDDSKQDNPVVDPQVDNNYTASTSDKEVSHGGDNFSVRVDSHQTISRKLSTEASETALKQSKDTVEDLDSQPKHVEPYVVVVNRSPNKTSQFHTNPDNQSSSDDEEATIIVVGEDDNDDDEDRIDIRDNANDEDQFAFDENNRAPSQSNFPGNSLEVILPDDNNDDNQQDDVGGNDDANAAANRVSFADEGNLRQEFEFDPHHIVDHYGGSRSESYEEEDDDEYPHEKSLDVLLLEEICEEAASMTIKEALIHSLKPNVRAGLTTAHLRLSESEILTLEGYCEDFVGGLIKDLLRRTSLLQDQDIETKKSVVQAVAIKNTAKQLSSMDLKQLKVYCDHFVHNVIAESIIDSSMIVAKQQGQAKKVKDILHIFKDSEELQEYFTSLTTDIVRTALINVVTKQHLEAMDDSDTIQSSETDYSESTSYSGDQESEGFDFDDDHNFGLPPLEKSQEKQGRTQNTQESHHHSYQMNNTNKASSSRKSKGRRLPQQPGEPLEFDMDWVENALQGIGGGVAVEQERRQKIVMRELDFDDHAKVGGTELLAPVFLAIAEENEDDSDFHGMRRKAQSIEDLCDYIEEEKEPPRKRSSSLNNGKPKRKQQPKPSPDFFKEYIQDEEKPGMENDLESAPSGDDYFEPEDQDDQDDEEESYQGDQEGSYEDEQEEAYTDDQEESYHHDQEELYQDSQEELYQDDQEKSYQDDQEESYQDDQEESYQDDQEGTYQEDHEESDLEMEFQAERVSQSPNSLDMAKVLQDKDYHAYDEEKYRWHTIRVNNREKVLDLRLIEPYMKVITHGGVHMPSRAVIVVVAACYLPDKSKRNYDFLMEQLFFYLISTLELLATADEYFLVYLNGGTSQANMPALPWMKRFYQHIEGGLKQQLIKMFIVHPNLWLKTVVRFAKAFVGTNFWSKLEFTKSLDDLSLQIPTEFMYIPDEVIRCDPKYKRLHNL